MAAKKKIKVRKKSKTASKTKRPKKSKKPARKAIKAKSPKKTIKATVKKARSAASIPKPGVIAPLNSVLLGFVEDYFAKVGVIALVLQYPVTLGARLNIMGHTTHIEQPLDSLQIEHQSVTRAEAKASVGIKITGRARRGDHVYLMTTP